MTVPYTSFSYVDLAVDWTRKIAYLASREPGKCLTAIDFADEKNPVILKVIGSATTPATGGSTCLGVHLYNSGTRLVLGVSGANLIEVWDLGADPRVLSWNKLSSVAVTGPKRFDVQEVSATQTRVYAGRQNGLSLLDITETAGTIAVTGSYTFTPGPIVNDATYLGDHFLVSSSVNAAPVHDVIVSTMTFNASFDVTDPSFTTPWSWSAARSLDGTLAYFGGFGGSFFQLSGGNISLTGKHKVLSETNGGVRDAAFSEENGNSVLYALRGIKRIYRWDLTNPAAPLMTHATTISDTLGEGYAIRVDATSNRGIVVTNRGKLHIIRTNQLDTVTAGDLSDNAFY